MTAALSVRRVATPRDFSLIANRCDELARGMQVRVPFATSKWLASWWHHYQESRPLVRDRFFVHTVHDPQGDLVAIAPLMLTERPGNGPLRSRSIAFFGGDKNITEIRGLTCTSALQGPVVRALLAHFCERGAEWDWFAWNGVLPDSEAYAALNEAKHFEWIRETADYVLPLPETWHEFRAGLSRNIKESLRKCYNSLKRDGHTFTFRVVSEAAELPAALQVFFDLHARRADAIDQISHANLFSSLQARRLLLDLAACSSDELRLRVFELEVGGKVVASRLGFVLGDELYLYFSGYDPAWGKYSVMTTTVSETIQWAIANKFRLVNLSPGMDVSKTRWGATAITTHNGLLLSPMRRGRFVFHVLRELNQLTRPGTFLGKFADRARRLG